MFYLSLSKPSASAQHFLELGKNYVDNIKPDSLCAGFAYASLNGAKRVLNKFASDDWDNIDKRFIIGLNQGITEPAAIRLLMLQPNLEVRLYIPGKKLILDALYAKPLFHAKVMFFEGGNKKSNLFYISSANLTGAAIGSNPQNYECGQVTIFSSEKKYAKQVVEFKSWWDELWEHSRQVDDKVLDKYSNLRLSFFNRNPDTLSLTEPSSDIAEADYFWIEVGKASGIDRHQLEFPLHLVSFFGKPKKKRRNLTLRNDKGTWKGRPLSYKRTTYNVDIWRLGMPTIRMGGEWIQDRVIRFSRTNEKASFEFEVTDVGSNLAIKWAEDCNSYGHLGQTRGANSRRYGYV